MKKNAKTISLIAAAVVLLILIIGYASGYRLGSHGLGKVGTVTMTLPYSGTSVFVDKSNRLTSNTNNESERISLSPGAHEIIVSHQGMYPWVKDVTVQSGQSLTLSPIFVAQNASGEIITANDPEYESLKTRIATSALPTNTAPLVSALGTERLWVDNNAILVETASTTTTVIQPGSPIKNVSFYKDRSDAVVFSVGNMVDVIETDTEDTQNFFPIYAGSNPYFAPNGTSSIYVLDNNTLYQVGI